MYHRKLFFILVIAIFMLVACDNEKTNKEDEEIREEVEENVTTEEIVEVEDVEEVDAAEEESEQDEDEETDLAEPTAEPEEDKRVDFTGYWLGGNIACHITESYITCAAPYSDFITHDEFVEYQYLSDTEVKVFFSDGTEMVLKFSEDGSSFYAYDETYRRVTKEDANAIFDGYYKLP